jgi:hypothetical protein
MIETIKKDFLQGLKTFKFWASLLSERLKVELNVLKLIGEINRLVGKRDELLKMVGKEVYNSWGSLVEIQENEKIANSIRQIRELDTEIEDKRKKLAELEDMSKWKF